METCLTIAQMAKRAGVTIRTLRYYDKIGLLKPSDFINDLDKLKKIQSLKFLGLSLKEIDDILKNPIILKDDLKKRIYYKKQEYIEEMEEIKRIIDKLNIMNDVINNSDHIDLSIFCFVVHAMIWEEQLDVKERQLLETVINNE
ncbi:MerR family transcriptional regulator [Bacillus sp. WMMC1349]|uniref:MerR family transcriptional regulator n=1 Tax=Bacillus sp. WMMC1349 TaxID=2736254 RepID=UPI0015582BD9|nr:MerR family transcriptional regulator [Bacillus sp. WMMC1349]NPC91368.1 MerR family transcriptional regulator [Bacillus sp. WMMC1349]